MLYTQQKLVCKTNAPQYIDDPMCRFLVILVILIILVILVILVILIILVINA
jgi:hypothetical protein